MASLDDSNLTQQQIMLAAMLAGAVPSTVAVAPVAAEEDTGEDAAPVPSVPGTPYTPLVSRQGGTEPSFGPPNLLAQALAGGGVSMPPAGLPGGAPADIKPSGAPVPGGTPAGTHYAMGPGAPLLLRDDQDALSGGPLAGLGRSLGIGGAPPASPMPTAAAASPGGPQASTPIAGQVSDIGQGTPEQREIYAARQAIREQAQTLRAQIRGASSPEVAKIYADQLGRLTTEDSKWESAWIATLHAQQETVHTLTPDEAKAGGFTDGIYQRDAKGTVTRVAGTEETKDPNEVAVWKAENADNIARGLPTQSLHSFRLEKSAAGKTGDVILGRDGNPIDETLTGQDVYNAVPPTVARMAKGMVDGTIKIPNMTVRTDPTAKQAFLVAQQADASLLDVNKVSARHEIEAGYARATPGSLGGQVNAGNTAGDHLADVVEAANDLKNVSGGGVPLIAHIANNLRNNITTEQSGKAGALEDGLLHYGQEISKFYAGAQTGEMERLRFLSALGNAKSPEEMAGVFRMEARQLGGKFVTLDEQVRGVMGDAASKYPVVRASSKENARRITAGLATLDPAGPEATGAKSPTDMWPGVGPQQRVTAAPAGASPQAPQPGLIKGGFRFRGGDPSQRQNWEPAQ